MIFRDDERAVSEQIGAILLFGMLIVSMSVYQATAVPQQNGQTEYQHSQQIQADLQAVHDAVLRTAATGMPQSTSVAVGTDYRSRTLFVNPPNPSGTLRTTGYGTVGYGIENARAIGPASKYWNGSTRLVRSEALRYTPDYHQYENAPTTVYESSVVADEYSNATVQLTGQSLVNGRTISLVELNGSRSISKTGTESVKSEPLSVSTNTVTVQGTDNGPIVLYVLTTLPESAWNESLSKEQYVDRYEYYTNKQLRGMGSLPSGQKIPVDDGQGLLKISLKPGTYHLRMAKVGIGSGATEPTPRYIVPVGSRNLTVPEGGHTQATVEVRDAYNNPVSGVEVNVTDAPENGSLAQKMVRTDSDGRATFTYESKPNVNGTTPDSFELGFDGQDADSNAGSTPNGTESVVFHVSTGDTDGSGSGGGNSNGSDDTPTAAFTYSPGQPRVGHEVEFNASGSSDNGNIVSYNWDFGDGTATTTDPTTSHTFDKPRTYHVKLTVTDGDGNTDTVTKKVKVWNKNQPPTADISVPSSMHSGKQYTFTASASDPDGTIKHYAWDFDGDNVFEGGTGSTATHAFDEPGTYQVALKVTDDDGQSTVVHHTVHVGGLVRTGDAEATSFTESGTDSRVGFGIKNNASTDLYVTKVRVSGGPSKAKKLYELTNPGYEASEVVIDGNGNRRYDQYGQYRSEGVADSKTGYDLGTEIPLDYGAYISSGQTRTLWLTEFVNGGNRPVDVGGSTITVEVTVVYNDSHGYHDGQHDTTDTITYHVRI